MKSKSTTASINRKLVKDTQKKIPASQKCSLSTKNKEPDKNKPALKGPTISRVSEAGTPYGDNAERFRNLVENINDGCFELDLAGNFTFINDSVCHILGYARDDVMGMNYRHYTDRETSKKLFKVYNKVYRTGKSIKELGWEITKKDGEKRYVVGSITLRKDSSGNPAGFMGIVNDITERNEMEKALKESDERFRALFEGSLDGVFIHDFEGNILDFNQAALDAAGYERDEMTSLNFASFMDAEQTRNAMKTIDELLQTGIQQKSNEYKLKRKDGSYVYSENKSAVIYRDGKPHAIIGIARNITERKKSEENLKKLLSDLQKALEEIKTLKGIVPICANCKKIRDDKGYWDQVESYLSRHTEATFSHSICPDCIKKLYPELCADAGD